MPAIASGADELANTLLASLIAGKDFTIPDIDLSGELFMQPPASGPIYETIEPINIDDLTTGQVNGTGVFDKLMSSLVKHLRVEYEANRISGAEYTKVYVGVVGAALGAAQQFVLAKDQAYWSSLLVQQQVQTAQIQGRTARIQLEEARVLLVKSQYDAANSEASYGLTKMKISTEDAAYDGQVSQTDGIKYTNTNILPAQKDGILAGNEQTEAQTVGIEYTNENLLPAQLAQVTAQTENTEAQTEGVEYTNTNLLPAQLAALTAQSDQTEAQTAGTTYTTANILPKQLALLSEQVEVQRAQTLDTRTDTAAVVGLIGKQKDLYGQQISSYIADGQTKAVKIWSDAFIAQKTIDEGLLPPDEFTSTNINSILGALRTTLEI